MATPTRRPEGYFIALGIPLGLLLGLPVALALGNIALGPALGIPVGLAIGVAMERRYNPDPMVRSDAETRTLRRVLLVSLVVGLVAVVSVAAFVLMA